MLKSCDQSQHSKARRTGEQAPFLTAMIKGSTHTAAFHLCRWDATKSFDTLSRAANNRYQLRGCL